MARSPITAFVGLGANLGDAGAVLVSALQALAALPGTSVQRVSPLYRSAPVDAQGPDFLNAVVQIETALSPHALLAALQAIEAAHGRERPYRNAPRTLDLDVLLFGSEQIDSRDLLVPHPRLTERAFVLRPLLDVAPQLEVPGRGAVRTLCAQVTGQRIERLIGPLPTGWPGAAA